jgi:hypothetical protein
MEPQLQLEMTADGAGHILVEVEITPDHLTQQHHFEFYVAEADLPDLVRQIEHILAKYPVRDEPRELAT